MPETPPDGDLIARIMDNLKGDPSEQLRDMRARSDPDRWSPEALEVARRLLDLRLKGTEPEPVYATEPTVPHPEQAPSSGGCNTGDAVLAPGFWGRACQFPGIIAKTRGRKAYIFFDNGDRHWVPLARVRPLGIGVGTRLYCRWRGEARYRPGTIVRCQGERLTIRYDDGDEEWTNLGRIMVPTGQSPNPLERFGAVYCRFTGFLKKLILGL